MAAKNLFVPSTSIPMLPRHILQTIVLLLASKTGESSLIPTMAIGNSTNSNSIIAEPVANQITLTTINELLANFANSITETNNIRFNSIEGTVASNTESLTRLENKVEALNAANTEFLTRLENKIEAMSAANTEYLARLENKTETTVAAYTESLIRLENKIKALNAAYTESFARLENKNEGSTESFARLERKTNSIRQSLESEMYYRRAMVSCCVFALSCLSLILSCVTLYHALRGQ